MEQTHLRVPDVRFDFDEPVNLWGVRGDLNWKPPPAAGFYRDQQINNAVQFSYRPKRHVELDFAVLDDRAEGGHDERFL